MLLGEVVLSTGEVNKKTRETAYEGLVALSRQLQSKDPEREWQGDAMVCKLCVGWLVAS